MLYEFISESLIFLTPIKQISNELEEEKNKPKTSRQSISKSDDEKTNLRKYNKSTNDNDKSKKKLKECWYFTNRQSE